MSDNVIPWNGVTKLDTDPQQIIRQAALSNLAGVVIIGFTADGEEYFASSYADGGNVIWHLERAKFKLLSLD